MNNAWKQLKVKIGKQFYKKDQKNWYMYKHKIQSLHTTQILHMCGAN